MKIQLSNEELREALLPYLSSIFAREIDELEVSDGIEVDITLGSNNYVPVITKEEIPKPTKPKAKKQQPRQEEDEIDYDNLNFPKDVPRDPNLRSDVAVEPDWTQYYGITLQTKEEEEILAEFKRLSDDYNKRGNWNRQSKIETLEALVDFVESHSGRIRAKMEFYPSYQYDYRAYLKRNDPEPVFVSTYYDGRSIEKRTADEAEQRKRLAIIKRYEEFLAQPAGTADFSLSMMQDDYDKAIKEEEEYVKYWEEHRKAFVPEITKPIHYQEDIQRAREESMAKAKAEAERKAKEQKEQEEERQRILEIRKKEREEQLRQEQLAKEQQQEQEQPVEPEVEVIEEVKEEVKEVIEEKKPEPLFKEHTGINKSGSIFSSNAESITPTQAQPSGKPVFKFSGS